MALITKDLIAEILGLVDSDELADSVYTWAIKQFFILTGLKEAEETKTYRKFIVQTTNVIKLPDVNIKSIESIKVDGTTISNLTEFVHYKYNPDTGFLWYSGGFGNISHTLDGEPFDSKCLASGSLGSGSLVEITYKINAYTSRDIHDYLIALLTTKALAIFTPEKVSLVILVKIGNYQQQFGSSSANSTDYMEIIDNEIASVVDRINGDDGKLTLGQIA